MTAKLNFSFEAIQDISTGKKTYEYVTYSKGNIDEAIKSQLHANLSGLSNPVTKGEIISLLPKACNDNMHSPIDITFNDFAHHLLNSELIGDFSCCISY